MAEGPRMTAAQLADKLLSDEHADVLRESVAWMARGLMEAEVAGKVGAELGERTPSGPPTVTGIGLAARTPESASSSGSWLPTWVRRRCAVRRGQVGPGRCHPEPAGRVRGDRRRLLGGDPRIRDRRGHLRPPPGQRGPGAGDLRNDHPAAGGPGIGAGDPPRLPRDPGDPTAAAPVPGPGGACPRTAERLVARVGVKPVARSAARLHGRLEDQADQMGRSPLAGDRTRPDHSFLVMSRLVGAVHQGAGLVEGHRRLLRLAGASSSAGSCWSSREFVGAWWKPVVALSLLRQPARWLLESLRVS